MKTRLKFIGATCILLAITIMAILSLSSCTNCEAKQEVVRKIKNRKEINLPKGEKLIDVTYDRTRLLYLSEPMDPNYTPKIKTLRNRFSHIEYVFIESK